MFYIVLRQEGSPSKTYKLKKSVVSVGRDASNDLSLTDPFASPFHAVLTFKDEGGFEIQDLGARHSMRINGRIIARHLLQDGDDIVIGESRLTYRSEDSERTPSHLAALSTVEKEHIIRILDYTHWHKSEASRILGITRQTLDNKLRKYGISR